MSCFPSTLGGFVRETNLGAAVLCLSPRVQPKARSQLSGISARGEEEGAVGLGRHHRGTQGGTWSGFYPGTGLWSAGESSLRERSGRCPPCGVGRIATPVPPRGRVSAARAPPTRDRRYRGLPAGLASRHGDPASHGPARRTDSARAGDHCADSCRHPGGRGRGGFGGGRRGDIGAGSGGPSPVPQSWLGQRQRGGAEPRAQVGSVARAWRGVPGAPVRDNSPGQRG